VLKMSILQLSVIIEILGLIIFLAAKKFKPVYVLISGFALLSLGLCFVWLFGLWGDSCGILEAIQVKRIGCSPAVFGFSYALILYGLGGCACMWIRKLF